MRCPVDGADMRKAEQEGVEIDYCPECRGVWLNRGELEKIVDRAMEEMDGPDGPDGDGPGGDYRGRGPGGPGPYEGQEPYPDRQGGGWEDRGRDMRDEPGGQGL